jgi:hypothetical protein
MKRFTLVAGALAILAVSLVSCRKEPLDMVNPNSRICKSYLQQFETVWQGMDQGYVFWDKDTVDWDERYEKFRPVFEAFDARPANNPVTQSEYWEAYTGLFEGLLDHHLTGRFYTAKGIPRGACEAWVSPGQNDYYHPTGISYERSLQLDILQKKAIPGTYLASDPFSYAPLDFPGSYFCLIKGKNEGELIAYFRFTNFYIMQLYAYHSALPNSYTAQAPIKAFYGPRYNEGITAGAGYANNDSVVGLIIDLRGNGGGSVADLEPIIGSLAQSDTRVGYTRVKEGFGRLDYSAWSESIVKCPSLHLNKEKPIVVLADVTSVSCAELATMLIKSLPNGVFIGERTYGAVGGLYSGGSTNVYHDLFYGGCFGDYDYFDNGPDPYSDIFSYYVYTSTFHMVDKDFNDVEGVGVKPDIEIKYNRKRLESGYDDQLDRAIRYIRVGH